MFAIIKIADGSIYRSFGSIPKALEVGQARIVAPVAVGDEGLGYRFIEVVKVDFQRPGTYYTQGADVRDQPVGQLFVGNTLTITRQWTAWTQPEIDAYESGLKDATANEFDDVNSMVRAMALVTLDELNRHNVQIAAILQAATDATSLATFKAAMANIQPLAERTPAQLKAAVRAKLGNGDL